MTLRRWLTKKIADTDGPTHSDLAPLDLPLPPAEVLPRLIGLIGRLPRWAVVSVAGTTIQATHRTRLWRFLDDVTLRLDETSTGTRLHARSQSRIGKGDFGQNRRNLLELVMAVRREFSAA
jgi:uncharacterized protein (DUF1499 family)